MSSTPQESRGRCRLHDGNPDRGVLASFTFTHISAHQCYQWLVPYRSYPARFAQDFSVD